VSRSAGIRALAAQLPPTARSNEYWRVHHPELVAAHERATLARVFTTADPAARSAEPFDAEMAPYLTDPFRGTVLRRVVTGSALELDVAAAHAALAAAEMSPRDVDLAIVCSFLPDQPGVGNAAFLARELGLRAPAFNLESTCSSALVALQTACAHVRAGDHRNVLVVVSCTYTRVSDPRDSLSWFLGDGAGAFIVGAVPDGEGVLGSGTVHTAETCGTFSYGITENAIRIGASASTARILRETAAGYLRGCVDQALARAGVALADIALFVFNTPTAWFAKTCARTLGISDARTVDTYPLYANMGPALMPINLHHAAVSGRIGHGDLVLVFTIGSVGTASAVVMRWGHVALGPIVAEPTEVQP
jgi:3-oxoacyl-[acyl-carrier-protein] synthase-3